MIDRGEPEISRDYIDLGRFAMKRVLDLESKGDKAAAGLIAVWGALTSATGTIPVKEEVLDAIGLAIDGKEKGEILSAIMSLLVDFTYVSRRSL